MSYNYAKTAASSLKLLSKFGQTVTRRTYTVGTYDTATGLVTPVTADSSRVGVALPFNAGQTMLAGTLIQNGDIQVLLDAEAAVALTDHYIVDGTEYTLAAFEPLSPAGTVVLNTLLLRAA